MDFKHISKNHVFDLKSVKNDRFWSNLLRNIISLFIIFKMSHLQSLLNGYWLFYNDLKKRFQLTFHFQGSKFSEQRPNLKFCSPYFVNLTMGNILNLIPNQSYIIPGARKFFQTTVNFSLTKNFKIDFLERAEQIFSNFFYSINLSVDKVYNAKNICLIATLYRTIDRKITFNFMALQNRFN